MSPTALNLNIFLLPDFDNINLGDKDQGIQEGQYFMVLTRPIFYDINQY